MQELKQHVRKEMYLMERTRLVQLMPHLPQGWTACCLDAGDALHTFTRCICS